MPTCDHCYKTADLLVRVQTLRVVAVGADGKDVVAPAECWFCVPCVHMAAGMPHFTPQP